MISESLFDAWYDSHKEDQGLLIAVGVFPDETIAPVNLARAWFNQRRSHINRKIKSNISLDEVTIFRCMKVSKNWIKDTIDGKTDSLGCFWTIDDSLVRFLHNGTGGSMDKDNVILEAKINHNELDFLSLLNPSYTEDFEEYEILPKDHVLLLKIWNGDKSEIIHDFNPPKMFRID
jgi:hypothetical protein